MTRALRQLVLQRGLLSSFGQPKRRISYEKSYVPRQDDEDNTLYQLMKVPKFLKEECGRCADEWKEKLLLDHPKHYDGELVPQFNFREQKDRDRFFIVAESDFNLGYSKGEFIGTRQSTGIFQGTLDTRVPRDGKTTKAGYIVLQGLPKFKSFRRRVYLDWEAYTHLVIRCRGDGRQYFINLHAYDDDDMNAHMMFSHPLYTRGGPYWQITTIPFSKFFIVHKGAVQDRQHRIELNKITKLGIALNDRTPGPFQLEIDYVACAKNRRDEDEEFAYETYETPNNYSYAFGM